MNKRFLFFVLAIMLTACNRSYFDGEIAYEAGDYKTAYKVWLALAEKNDAIAQDSVANLLSSGRGVNKIDYSKAFEFYKKSAQQGNLDAMYNIGNAYLYNKGVAKDFIKAALWYKKAAAGGNVAAMNALKDMYVKGNIDISLEHLKTWYIRSLEVSAAHGSADSMLSLADIYESGKIMGFSMISKIKIVSDLWYFKAYEAYRIAAEKDGAYAMLQLGNIYANGWDDIEDSRAAANEWYKKAIAAYNIAALKNNIDAMWQLKDIYETGSIVPKDKVLVKKWHDKIIEYYKLAAKKGDPQAMVKLGDIYSSKDNKDIEQAKKYYAQAVTYGDWNAQKALELIEANITK